MEAMKTSGKSIKRGVSRTLLGNIKLGTPQAPITGGLAGLTFDQLRAIRTHLIAYHGILESQGKIRSAHVVNIRINEVIVALKEVS